MATVVDQTAATLAFTAMSMCVKWAEDLPTLQIVFFRGAVALAIGLVQLRWAGLSLWGGERRLLLARGLFGTGALIAYFWSLGTLPLGTATVLQGLAPLFTALFGILLLGERPTVVQIVAFFVALGGVLVVEGAGEGGGVGGVLIGVLGATLSACAYTIIARIGPREHPLVVVAWFPLVTVPLVGLTLPFVWVTPTAPQWAALVGVGVFVQVAQIFMTRALQRGPIVVASMTSYLGVVWSGLVGWLVFSEGIAQRWLLGTALVVGAVLAATAPRRPRAPTEARPG
jgi:drug/metabolite transporter (DMT)-like permease